MVFINAKALIVAFSVESSILSFMTPQKTKIVAVVGPTASGKSDLAVVLAKAHEGEVISADSRQVYRGMDIGTGKITTEEMERVPHHLLDVADPMEVMTVGEYKTLADQAIREIALRGHLPILCGGTGFYIQAVTDGLLLPDVPPDPALRATLSSLSTEALFTLLKEKDLVRAQTIDAKNPHRLIRAIEIASALGAVPPLSAESPYDTLLIGITLPDELLRERIHRRLLDRVEHGMLEEMERLHSEGVSWERMEDLGLEYRYCARYLEGQINKDTMLRELEMEIVHYAKRQYTWFRRNPKINWVERGDLETPERLLSEFLSS